MHPRFAFRIIGLLLLLSTCSLLHAGERFDQLPLQGGCITTPTQYLLYGNVASPINATVATDGVAGTYAYQWQSSVDGVTFTNIAGATSQNLSFSSPLPQTTWFQRKTTSGMEVAYTGTVQVIMASVLYYNVVKTGSFTRNNCGGGSSGTTVTYTVAANTYVSATSQADADAKAQNDVNANGQNYANTNAPCLWYSVLKNGTYIKNNCSAGGTGSSVTYTVAANTYSSAISQADADAKAQNDVNTNGQTYANNNGYCTWVNTAQSGTYTRNNCQSGATPTSVVYTVAAGTYSSTVSQADANQKAVNDVNANGQNYANNNAVCTNIFVRLRNNGGLVGTFGFTIKNTSGTVLYGKSLDGDFLPFSVAVPAASYIVEMTAMSGTMYAIVNGTEKAVSSTGTSTWNSGNVVNIEVSQTALYRNVAQSVNFTRNNCASGFVGSTVTYTVGAGTYSSSVSQADADQQATNDVNANGQNYANTNGTCTQVQNVTVTLTNAYTAATFPNPVTVEFIQNGITKYTGTFPNAKTGSNSMTVQAGSYTLKFTMPSSWANAPESFTLNPGATVWSKGINSNQTVITTGTVAFTFGTAYTITAKSSNID